jgi:uncharacterized repeat protein (TIGR02543 family)
MKTKVNKSFLRRVLSALVLLCMVLSVNTVSLSAPEEPFHIPENIEFTAAIEGNRVVVRNQDNVNVTYSNNYIFDFQWLRNNEIIASTGAASAFFPASHAEVPGVYRCRVTFTNQSGIPSNVNNVTFYSNEVIITLSPNTIPYTAYILGSFSVATNNVVQVNLNAVVRNQSGVDVTNSGDFEFRWERQDKVNGLPVGYFVPISGAYSATFSGAFNSPSFIRCRVTYVGDDGEPQSSVIFYTAPVNWTPVLSYSVGAQPIYTTSATTTVGRNLIISTDRPPGFPAGAPFGQGQFNTNTIVVARVNASGQLIIELSDHNLQGGGNVNTIGSYFQLHRLTDGETGEDLFDGVGVNAVLPNGNSTYTFTSASPLPGEGLYSFRFRVWRQNPAFDVVITGFVNISASASNGVLTDVDSTPIPPNGIAGDSLLVDYPPSYQSALIGTAGNLPVILQHPAYRITYDFNGGSGSMNLPLNPLFSSLTVNDALFNVQNPHTVEAENGSFVPPPNHGFAGWNTAADGSGTAYAAGTPISVLTENITLYAQWSQDIFTVTFDLDYADAPAPTSAQTQSDRTLSALPEPTRDGYIFGGWEKADGTKVTLNTIFDSNTTVFAQWELDVFTIYLDPNGGSGTMLEAGVQVNGGDSYTVRKNEFIPPLNHEFDEWNTEPDGSGTAYFEGDIIDDIRANLTLYAQWRLIPPEFNFTDMTGTHGMTHIFLPADSADILNPDDPDGVPLNGAGIRVYFMISEYTDIVDVSFRFGTDFMQEATAGELIPDDDIEGLYYFYLSPNILNVLQNTNEIVIRGTVAGGLEEKYITIRKIGLFRLH